MTRAAKQRRRRLILSLLSNMSRDWSKWTAADWAGLEAELDQLNGELR